MLKAQIASLQGIDFICDSRNNDSEHIARGSLVPFQATPPTVISQLTDGQQGAERNFLVPSTEPRRTKHSTKHHLCRSFYKAGVGRVRSQTIKAYLYAEGSDRIPTRPGSDRKPERQLIAGGSGTQTDKAGVDEVKNANKEG